MIQSQSVGASQKRTLDPLHNRMRRAWSPAVTNQRSLEHQLHNAQHMGDLLRQIRYASRMLLKNRAFTGVAVGTLALGIGVTTAVYSLADVLLYRPLMIPDLDRIVNVAGLLGKGRMGSDSVSPADFLDLRRETRTLDFVSAAVGANLNVTGGGDPQRVSAYQVSPSFFSALGVQPKLGRAFASDEDMPGKNRIVVLSHALWMDRYGADPNVLTRTIQLQGEPYQIVGVMPKELRYPTEAQLWVPLTFTQKQAADRATKYVLVVGRLKPGVTIQQASAETAGIVQQIAAQFPESHRQYGAHVVLVREYISGNAVPGIVSMLLGAVFFLLLIACSNVANIQFARVSSRGKEIAVRSALGASRMRLLSELLTESVVLGLIGAGCGLLVAVWTADMIHRLIPAEVQKYIPSWDRLGGLNGRVLLFTLAAAVLSGIVAGVAPAFLGSRADLNDALKENSRGATSGVGRHRVRNALVVAQIMLALVLLVGAALTVKGLRLVNEPAPNLDPEKALTMRLTLADSQYPTQRQRAELQEQLLERVVAVAGVESAGLVHDLPYSGNHSNVNITIEGERVQTSGSTPRAQDQSVTPGYFRTLHQPLISGREFNRSDSSDSTPVAIVSQSLAANYFPGQNPIGKHLRIGLLDSTSPWLTIVGIVSNIRADPFERGYPRVLYRPMAQAGPHSFTVLLRSSGDPMRLLAPVRAQIVSLNKDQPIYDIGTLKKVFGFGLTPVRFIASLMSGFGVLALLLSSIGVYSVMAHSVTERNHEIGVRMALGAAASDVLWMVVRRGLILTLAGVIIGLPAALALARLMAGLFFGVPPNDLPMFATGLGVLASSALLASYLPARRATQVDPMITLRNE